MIRMKISESTKNNNVLNDNHNSANDYDVISMLSSSPTGVSEYALTATCLEKDSKDVDSNNASSTIGGNGINLNVKSIPLSCSFSSSIQDFINLDDFVYEIPGAISERKSWLEKLQRKHNDFLIFTQSSSGCYTHNDGEVSNRQEFINSAYDGEDPVMKLMRFVQLDDHEVSMYAYFDPSPTSTYTRNLVATDDRTYTLLLLCWKPGMYSPIHDHPCDGCWMKVIQGTIHECQYKYNSSENNTEIGNGTDLICIKDSKANVGDVMYIDDTVGLHKVGNPSLTVPAITLHLYSPPFKHCKTWKSVSQRIPEIATICNNSIINHSRLRQTCDDDLDITDRSVDAGEVRDTFKY